LFELSSSNKNIAEIVHYSTLRAVQREVEAPLTPTVRPDTAPKAVNDDPQVHEPYTYTKALNHFLILKALKHPNQFISIPRIKLYTVTADEVDDFSGWLKPLIIARSDVLSVTQLGALDSPEFA
jgi:hypothetical protein